MACKKQTISASFHLHGFLTQLVLRLSTTSIKAQTEILWCLFVCQYAPQQLWRPIIVCNSLITNNNLCYRTTSQVYHLITWWSANRRIDVVVFFNCALSSVSAGYLPKSRKGGEEKNRCWQGRAHREREGQVAWGSWERKLREEKETVVPESGWQSEEAFLGLVRNKQPQWLQERKKKDGIERTDGRTDGAPWHPSSNSMPGYSQDLQELYTWESSKSSLYPGLGLSTRWSTVSFACIQDLV